jgi:hypothetical protein
MSNNSGSNELFWWMVAGFVAFVLYQSFQPRPPKLTYEQWEKHQRVLDEIERKTGDYFLRTPPPGDYGESIEPY